MTVELFSVLDRVDVALREDVIRPAYEVLSQYVRWPLRSGMVLLTAAFGYKMLRGGNPQGISGAEIWWLIVKMGIVAELLLNWGTFNTWILSTLWGTYHDLSTVLAGAVGGGGGWGNLSGSVLDNMFRREIGRALGMIFAPPSVMFVFPLPFPLPLPIPNIIPNVAGVVALVMTVVLFASVFLVLLMSRVGLVMCLSVAPIFIALSLFQHTKSYSDAWFRGLLGFLLTPLLLVVVLVIGGACMNGMKSFPMFGDWDEIFMPLLAYLLLYYALAKAVSNVPQFASGMVGSMLSHIGDGATQQMVGRIHQGLSAGMSAGVGAAKGAAGRAITGGKLGA